MRTCCGYFVIVGCITFWMLMKEYCTHEYYFDIIERIQFFYYSPPDQVHWEFSSMNGEGEFSSMRYARKYFVRFILLQLIEKRHYGQKAWRWDSHRKSCV
ncbi:uncharacterized protein LOC112036418 isoform X3 [Quercus suber]|uniref:uncharacterized protein LOC112036418 isoform X3 n=1 Tax=Quercus suber TaxID=58331 RepID=UPI0032DF81C5